MQIKLLTNLGSNDWPGLPWLEGETHEVNDLLGKRMIHARVAVEVEVIPKPEPPKAIAEEMPPPIAAPVKETKETEQQPNQKADKFSETRAGHRPPTKTSK